MLENKVCNLNLLPLGRPDFSNIRKNGKVYVDKTALIAKIAEQDVPIFLSRPRRFGKTLLVNTLYNLFHNGLDDFSGLEIEKLWQDKTYNVVRLDFSRTACNNYRDFYSALTTMLIDRFGINDKLDLNNIDSILISAIDRLDNYSTVLLIDEYDAPLTHNIDQPDELENIISTLNKFYAAVKECMEKFRFIFITGITRTSHLSIFSAFNNLEDLSFDEEYNQILGFTQNDLFNFFDPYVENAANILNMTKEEMYVRIKDYYDGFNFVLNSKETLYNPWSILSFLHRPHLGFRNYWFDSGGTSTIVMKYLKMNNLFDYLNYRYKQIYMDSEQLNCSYEINNIPTEILLCQAGYFTPRMQDDGSVVLFPPNTEVEESLLRLYLTANNIKIDNQLRSKINSIVNYIDEHNLKAIVEIFNNILNSVISIKSKVFEDERSVRDIIFASILSFKNLEKYKEKESLKGFSDLELITKKTHMVIEFKRTYPKDPNKPKCYSRSPKASLNAAITQLKKHNYGKFAFENKTLYRVAMVISTEEKKILPAFCQEVLD